MMELLNEAMAAAPALFALLLLLAATNAGLTLRDRSRQRGRSAAAGHTLHYLLDLIQRLQKHRALGGRDGLDAKRQRQALARELKGLWQAWPNHFPNAGELVAEWEALQRNARDFDGHCNLIDRLLAAMTLVEQRLVAAPATRDATSLGERCRTIEDLGRLRGLAVRAAAIPSAPAQPCPVQLEVPLRYLCLRLAQAEPEVCNALREIERRLLQRQTPAMSADDCYELLTPLIDRKLDRLRAELRAVTTPAHSDDGRLPTPAAVPIWSTTP